jgi:hypothetical protein
LYVPLNIKQWSSWAKRGGSGAAAPGGTVQGAVKLAAEIRMIHMKFLGAVPICIAKKHLLVSSNLSVCTHETTRATETTLLNQFSRNFISEIFVKNCRTIPNFMMIGKPEVVIITNSFSRYD